MNSQTKIYDNRNKNSTGIYGDLFDTNRQQRFGSPIEDCADHDKATYAKTTLVKPKISQQKKFEHYVLRNVEVFEAEAGSQCISNIRTLKDLQQRSVSSLKTYQQLKTENRPLPKLDRINHRDYLPNRIKKRGMSLTN